MPSTTPENNTWRMHFIKSPFVHISAIIVLALFLRLYKFRYGEVLVSSDEVFAFEISLKPVYGLLSGDPLVFAVQLFRFFNYPWAWVSLVGTTITSFILTVLNIPITEFTINFSHIIVGVVSIVSLYLLSLLLTGKRRVAFFSALIFAILPVHIALSRSITVNVVYSTSLFFLTLALFVSYFKNIEKENEKSRKYLVIGMIVLGLYLGSDNQFLGILPILFFSGLLFYKNKNIFKRIILVIRTFLSKYVSLFLIVALPLIASAVYLIAIGLARSSYLNFFHSKQLVLNLYYPAFLSALYDDVGPGLLGVFFISFLYNFFMIIWTKEQRDTRLLVLFWFIVTATPWLFLLSPEIVQFRLYILQPIACLVIYSGLLFSDIFDIAGKIRGKLLQRLLGGCCIFIIMFVLTITIISASNLVYQTNYLGLQFPPIFGGVVANTGIKTIGFYVRNCTPKESSVFVDVESFVGQYYFSRKIVGDLDLTDEQMYDQLVHYINLSNKKGADKKSYFDYAFINNKHFTSLGAVLEKNKYSVIVVGVDGQGVTVAKLYKKQDKKDSAQVLRVLPIQQYDLLFNEKYGWWRDLYVDFGR